MTVATSAARFLAALGVNTHIDFAAYGYQNLATVESNINYLGVKIVRDSAEVAADAQTWLQVSRATGAKFDDYIAETSPADMKADLAFVQQLAQEGILASIEGGNEEDDSYPASLGNTVAITAQFQQQVFAVGQQYHLPIINMSFGAGWTAANNWQGDYGSVGDLSAYANYANAHSYPNPGQLPDDTIQRMNSLANLAASTRPVMTTEIGWDTTFFSQQTIAKYVLDAAMDGIRDGDAGMYYYALYDDASGNWGLFNANGTPRPAATALHNMNTLLADTGASAVGFVPGSLNYTLSGTQAGDNSVLIEKSNGHFWLSLRNETEAANTPHTITVNLGTRAATVLEFDPLTGTKAISSWSNVSSIQVQVPDHPVLLDIVPGSGASAPPPPPPPPGGPAFAVPTGETTVTGVAIVLSGIVVTDSFAASNSGSVTLNVNASNGLITMTAGVSKLAGSGTHAISVTGTLAQINAELATLSYSAVNSAGNDVITIDVWDQAGLEGTKSFDVAVTKPPSTAPSPPPPPKTGPLITIPTGNSVTAGSTIKLGGVSITDAFAASNAGALVLNVSAATGLITMTNASGAKLAGPGTHIVSVTGTLAQINADISHLSYTAGSSAGTDAILVDVWDQAGNEGSKSIAVTVNAAAQGSTSPMPVIKVAATDAEPVITVSGTTINASSGNHMFFIGGTGDVLTASGGNETVMAFQGGNTITTGAGNDTIRIAGTGNVISAGGGTNEIDDSGSNNRIVLPQSGKGSDDIYGYVLLNGDTLDLRPLLVGTQWNGNAALLGNFVSVAAPNGGDTVISVHPTGTALGASYTIATLHGSGGVSLSSLLAHSLT